jgi:virulence-associated protein VagC
MNIKITDAGLSLPKEEWFKGVEEVAVRREGARIVIVPLKGPIKANDPIWELSKNPISDDNVTDASTNLDNYLY